MTSSRTTIEANANTVRGPWEETLRPALPVAVPATDPRLELSDQALVLASQNAFPIVATRQTRRDNVGLAAGAAIALVLGCATFVSLSSSRHSQTSPAAAPTAALPAPTAMPGRPMVVPPAAVASNPQAGTMPGMNHMPAMAPMAPPAAPVLVYDGSAAPNGLSASAGPNTPRAADGAPALLAGADPGGRGFASDRTSVRSTKLALPAQTVIQGTLIPAVLETAIDTDVPGYVRAVVTQ